MRWGGCVGGGTADTGEESSAPITKNRRDGFMHFLCTNAAARDGPNGSATQP